MSHGITAAIVVVAFILSMTILSGIGFYGEMGITIGSGADDEVTEIDEDLQGLEAQDRGDGIFSGFTTGPGNALSSLWIAIFETPKLIKTFLPVGNEVANPIGRFLQILFGIGFLMFIRGVTMS